MSADVLRATAAAMRGDASKATPGRWKAWGMQALADQDGTSNVDTAVPVASTFCCDEAGHPRTFDLDHIIGLQPAVALAVADLLDAVATDLDLDSRAYTAAVLMAQTYLASAP